MKAPLFLAVALFAAPMVFAQSADLRIVRSNFDVEPTTTGERFTFDMAWRNDGPDAAHFLLVTVSGSPVPFYLLNVATSGWPCYPTADAATFTCQNATLAAGAEAELVLHMFTPPSPGPFTLRAEVRGAEPDLRADNNTVQYTMNLEPTAPADLSVSPQSQLYRAHAGDDVTIPIQVANAGPTEVRNIFAVFTVPVREFIPPFSATGEGWSCQHPAYGPQVLTCTRSRLRAGESAPLSISMEAPPADGTLPMTVRVRGEGHSDPDTTNDLATATIQVGSEQEPQPQEPLTRILVPLTGDDVPGVGGALWRTETTMLVDAGMTEPPLRRCSNQPTPPVCSPLTVGTPFNPRGSLIDSAHPNGQFIYVREADAAKIHINSRVFDVSRATETAGSEIPVVRGSLFTPTRVSLLGIPVASQYRHALRVYELDAKGGRVRVRVYANGETAPRADGVHSLTVVPGTMIPYATGPENPGYLQLDLGQLMSMSGVQTLRVDVEPFDEGLRLWSFVSITNNDTHHVTTFSQH